MSQSVSIDEMASAIIEGLEEYADLSAQGVKSAVRKSAKAVSSGFCMPVCQPEGAGLLSQHSIARVIASFFTSDSNRLVEMTRSLPVRPHPFFKDPVHFLPDLLPPDIEVGVLGIRMLKICQFIADQLINFLPQDPERCLVHCILVGSVVHGYILSARIRRHARRI